MIHIFPPALLYEDKLEEVIIFLQRLPVDTTKKKEALVFWTKFVGVTLTEEIVKKVIGPTETKKLRG